MRIWSRALDSEEVTAGMSGPVAPDADGLERFYSFDGQGLTIVDETGNSAPLALPTATTLVAGSAPNAERVQVEGTDATDVIDASFVDVDGDTMATDTPGSVVLAGAGDDIVQGSSADETILGQSGNDTLSGGGGRDTFDMVTGDGTDVITDFDPALDRLRVNGVDITDLNALPEGVTGSIVDEGFVLSYGDADSILLL